MLGMGGKAVCFLLCIATWEDNRNRDQAFSERQLCADSLSTPHAISLLSHERACMLLEVIALLLGQLCVPVH